jgi:hypothetical protein
MTCRSRTLRLETREEEMTMVKKSEASTTAFPDLTGAFPGLDMESMIAANQHGLKAALEANEHLFGRITTVNRELFRFLNRRMEKDRELVGQLGKCQSPEDIMGVYTNFFEVAMKQYAEEMGQLAKLYARQTKETVEDAQHQVDEATPSAAKK